MNVYEGTFQVADIDVYTTGHFTTREAVIDQIMAERYEILDAVTGSLNNMVYNPKGSDEENAEALKLYDRCVAAMKSNDWIDDEISYSRPVFAAILKRKIRDHYEARA